MGQHMPDITGASSSEAASELPRTIVSTLPSYVVNTHRNDLWFRVQRIDDKISVYKSDDKGNVTEEKAQCIFTNQLNIVEKPEWLMEEMLSNLFVVVLSCPVLRDEELADIAKSNHLDSLSSGELISNTHNLGLWSNTIAGFEFLPLNSDDSPIHSTTLNVLGAVLPE